jgi:hypothetical protein
LTRFLRDTSGVEVFERLPDIAGTQYFENRLRIVSDALEKSDISLIASGTVVPSIFPENVMILDTRIGS